MKIAICTPVHSHPTKAYTDSLADLLIHSASQCELKYLSHQNTDLAFQRTTLAKRALDWGADAILWIDADHSFPAHGLITLLNHGQNIVGCNYLTRQAPHRPTAGNIAANGEIEYVQPGTGLEQVDGLGFGFILTSCQALRRISEPWFEAKSEDYAFCAKAKAAGIPVMLDHDLSREVGHIAETVLKF